MSVLARIRDPIHNLVSFSDSEDDRLLAELIDTAPIQRLRRIKQLGYSEFVYPGATHTRFSHSIGAMQMARRMLGAFKRDPLFADSEEHRLMARATVAAALLHDLGHGPYSHVFEELMEHVGEEKSHEEYTKEFIRSPEIIGILKRYGADETVPAFFEKEVGDLPYSAIISSQMDCDRLDFLVRDRYFTGIQSSLIDLEWLFDSLSIEKVVVGDDDVEKYSFVVSHKGLRVVEEFVVAYMKMYNDVYFHKTTRAVQHMVVDCITGALDAYPDAADLNHSALVKFLQAKQKTIDAYRELDDSHVVALVHVIADGKFGQHSELARRYLRRDLYKALEIPPMLDGSAPAQLNKRFREKLDNAKLWYKVDVVKGRGYKQYDVSDKKYLENIIVRQDGEHMRLHAASKIIRAIEDKRVRFYFRNDVERQTAKNLLADARAHQ